MINLILLNHTFLGLPVYTPRQTRDVLISPYLAKKEAATEVPVDVSLATQVLWEAGKLYTEGLSALYRFSAASVNPSRPVSVINWEI